MMPKKTGWTIAEVSTSGGGVAAIDSHFDDIQLADISPSGSELLIGQFDDETDVPIYILPLPAGLPRRVGDVLAHAASWSPNGEQIVYARGNELFLAKPDGSESRRLVTLSGSASWPRWSPDGKILRFTLDGLSLWEVASDGTGLRQLLPTGAIRRNSAVATGPRTGITLSLSPRAWTLPGLPQLPCGLFGKRVDFSASTTQYPYS